jgi:hypothetical protein
MGLDFFRIARGLELDETIQLLQGTGSPGAGDSANALVGSVYLDNLNGDLWTKITVGAGISHWSKMASENWVQNSVAGAVSWREPALVIDTSTTTLPTGPGADVVDGVTLVDGDRVVFAGLTPDSPNVYTWDAANDVYVEDINTLSQGDTIYIDAGTAGGTRWTWNGTAWVRFDSASIDELAFIRAYNGKPAAGSLLPVYSSASIVTQNANLTTAISELDAELGAGVVTGNFISASDSLNVNLQAVDAELGANVTNGNFILAASKMNGNIQSLDTALGAPIAGGHPWVSNAAHVNGNLIALADELGANVSNGNWILTANTVNQNIDALDTHLGAQVTSGAYVINSNSANDNIQLLDDALGVNVTTGNFILASNPINNNIQAIDTEIGANVTDGTYILSSQSINTNVQAIDTALNEISKETTAPAVTTSTVVDTVAATLVKWIVKIVDSANSANVYAAEVLAVSNGLGVDFTRFAVLKAGANIPGVQISANLSGANIQLLVQSTASVNVTARRVSSL